MPDHISSIHIQKLCKSFVQGTQETSVLAHVTYTFDRLTTTALTGVSGTGKSTLLHLLGGLDAPTSGDIYFDKHNIHSIDKQMRTRIVQNRLGLLFQSAYLIDELSIVENVMIKGLIAGQPYKSAATRAGELLESVGLSHKADSRTPTLSGGEQQRVALARALFSQPDFILADEPTAHLDMVTKKTIIDLLLSCHRQWGMGLIVATHDDYVAQRMDVVLRLENGTIKEMLPHELGSEVQVLAL